MKLRIIILGASLLAIAVSAGIYRSQIESFFKPKAITEKEYAYMTEDEYETSLIMQDQFYSLLTEGAMLEKSGRTSAAEEIYLKALDMARGSSGEGVTRGRLTDLYEKTGQYEKALEHAEWFVQHALKNAPPYPNFVERRDRLLKKIQEASNVKA